MKKTNIILLALICIGGTSCSSEDSYDSPTPNEVGLTKTDKGYFDGTLYYSISTADNQTVEVSSSEANNATVKVPNTVIIDSKQYSVVKINQDAFKNNTLLQSVFIPRNVKSIGTDAFGGCSNLTQAEFESIETLCQIDFANERSNPISYAKKLYISNKEMTVVEIPSSVTSIKNYTFYSCESLSSVKIPGSVTSIGDRAFMYSGLTSITIPSSVKIIGKDAFAVCKKLSSLTLQYGITSIGESCFSSCTSLYSVTLPSSLKDIGKAAFIGSGITSINIPEGITNLTSTFMECHSLTSATIPSSVTNIVSAFYGCTSLNNVYCYIRNPKSCDQFLPFYKISESATLYIPYGTRSYYSNWEKFFNRIVEMY